MQVGTVVWAVSTKNQVKLEIVRESKREFKCNQRSRDDTLFLVFTSESNTVPGTPWEFNKCLLND